MIFKKIDWWTPKLVLRFGIGKLMTLLPCMFHNNLNRTMQFRFSTFQSHVIKVTLSWHPSTEMKLSQVSTRNGIPSLHESKNKPHPLPQLSLLPSLFIWLLTTICPQWSSKTPSSNRLPTWHNQLSGISTMFWTKTDISLTALCLQFSRKIWIVFCAWAEGENDYMKVCAF